MPASSVALAVVAVAGLFLALLGCVALIAPARAKAFLLGFAATPRRHILEMAVRMAVGLAFILAAPRLPGQPVFLVAGTVLVGTTAVLAVLPFRFHQAFARRSVPGAMPYLPAIGLISLAAGLAIAWSACVGSAA